MKEGLFFIERYLIEYLLTVRSFDTHSSHIHSFRASHSHSHPSSNSSPSHPDLSILRHALSRLVFVLKYCTGKTYEYLVSS